MPAGGGTKRVRGVSVYRPFVYGSEAWRFNGTDVIKPSDAPEDHTHKWRVFVKGVNDEDISYWLKKVQFKLHETYAQSVRTVESPPFEVTETGWGEFEIQVKLFFVGESTEKAQTLWHGLKLHPYGQDAQDTTKERKDPIVSQNYEEVVFNEPVEQFYDILTGGTGQASQSKGKAGKGAKQQQAQITGRTAEIPYSDSPNNPYSQKAESKELDRLSEAVKTVEKMLTEEKQKLTERDAYLMELKKNEGITTVPKKK